MTYNLSRGYKYSHCDNFVTPSKDTYSRYQEHTRTTALLKVIWQECELCHAGFLHWDMTSPLHFLPSADRDREYGLSSPTVGMPSYTTPASINYTGPVFCQQVWIMHSYTHAAIHKGK